MGLFFPFFRFRIAPRGDASTSASTYTWDLETVPPSLLPTLCQTRWTGFWEPAQDAGHGSFRGRFDQTRQNRHGTGGSVWSQRQGVKRVTWVSSSVQLLACVPSSPVTPGLTELVDGGRWSGDEESAGKIH